MPPASPIIAVAASGLSKVYGDGITAVTALRNVDISIYAGQFTAIMGPSGSGKSTLMHLLAGLDTPTAGSVQLAGINVTTLDDDALTRLRRDEVGFVFQSFNLIPTLTASENIRLPADLAGRAVDQAWFTQVVEAVGLGDRLRHRPSEMSGGQQQRVAIARALVTRPTVVFADEPTGNLDSAAGGQVLALLRQAVAATGQTVVMVTHDPTAAAHADRVVILGDGEIRHDITAPTVQSIVEIMSARVV